MRLSFLSKLIVFGVLLGTLPVIFIGAFAYVTSSNEIERRVNEGKMQLLHQTSANVEQILTTVNHTLNQATNSTVLRRSLDSPLSASDFKAYNDLSMELRHMQSFDTRVEDVVLINTRHNWMIKNSGLYRFDDYEHADALEALLQAGEDTVWTLTPTAWFYSEESANHIACPYTISLVKRLPAASLEKFALAIANIPTCALSELLAHGQEAGAALMILDERRRVLLHTNPDRIGLPVEETGLLDLERMERATAPFAATIGSERYSVGLHRSDFNGWTYVSAVSVDDLMQESRKIGLYTVYICLSMLALSALLAWFGSRRMYSPIRALLGQMKDRLPVDAGPAPGNEFQAIGEQLQRLFQSNSRLEKELGLHLQQARTFALMKAFQGQLKPNDIEGKLDASGFGSQLRRWRSMAVVTLQIDALDPARFGRNDLELVLFAVQNIAEELIDADARLQPIVIDHTLVTLIGSEEADLERFAAQAYEWTEKLQRSIRHYLSLQVSAGISLPFQGVDRLTAAYREGLEALKHRLKLGEGVIIPYENLNAGKHFLLLNYPNQSENDLFDAIKLADAPKARELLKQLLHTILAAELAPQDYQIPLARLLNNLVIAAQASASASCIRPTSRFTKSCSGSRSPAT